MTTRRAVRAPRVEVPDTALGACDLEVVDYADAFRGRRAFPVTPAIAQARITFEAGPAGPGRLTYLVWTRLARFPLERRGAPGHVLGWRVVGSTGTEAVLAADGPALRARIVVTVDGTEATTSTFIEFRSRYGRELITRLQGLHRLIVSLFVAAVGRHGTP